MPDRKTLLVSLLFVLGAVAAYLLVYEPQYRRRIALQRELRHAQKRTTRLRWRLNRLAYRRDALRDKDPETIRESIRAVLHKGHPQEYTPAPAGP